MEDIKKYENMTVQEKWSILAMVANLYYNSEMTQNEIADRMYTSTFDVFHKAPPKYFRPETPAACATNPRIIPLASPA